MSRAVQALGRSGWQVEGQVVITRNAATGIAREALRLPVEHVVLAAPRRVASGGFVQGDRVVGVRRRLKSAAQVNSRADAG